MAKTAAELLIEYGYTEVRAGMFIPNRPSSERWEKVDGGWHCYAPPVAAMDGGPPWGRAAPAGSSLVQLPFTQNARYAAVGGLHPALQPEAFEWVWPEERLVEIYTHQAVPGKGNVWRKTDEGKYVRDQ